MKMGINYDALGIAGMTLALTGAIAWLQLKDWLFLVVVLIGGAIMTFYIIENIKSYFEIKKINRRINFVIEQLAIREHMQDQRKK
jgi:TRAP-type C4-dicarboxylate transport system permease small subunit